MAVLALGLVGSAVASYLGVAATYGFVAGELLGNLLFPQKSSQEGPRVGDLTVQASTYGTPIPIVYGAMRLAGNVIFCTDKREVKNSQTSGGKGGPKITTTTYTYNVDMAVALCEGPIQGLRKMWLNGKLVYDASETASITSTVASSITANGWKVYLGDESQLADPTMEATLGAGNVPGYRGMAYVVFDHLDCPNGQIPQLSFEVVASGASAVANPIFQQPVATDPTLATITEKQALQFTAANGTESTRRVGPGWDQDNGARTFSATADGAASQLPPVPTQGGDFGLFCWFENSSYSYPMHLRLVGLDDYSVADIYGYTPGTTANSLRPVYAAYDSVTGKVCAVADAGQGADRSSYITIMPSGVLTVLLDTAGCPMAFYNDVIYTCGVSGGVTKLNKYNGDDGTLIGSVSAPADYGASTLLVHASANGVYVIEGQVDNNTVNRRAWKVGSSWELLTSTARYDNLDGKATTWWSNDEYGIVGPSGVAAGRVTYSAVRYNAFSTTAVAVGDIISSIAQDAGLTTGQLDTSDCTDDVHGFTVSQVSPARNSTDPLMRTFFVDPVETDGKLKFLRRTSKTAVASIPYDDLGTIAPGNQATDPFPLTRTQEAELPRSVALSYYNYASDYQSGTETARRQVTSSINDVVDQLPIAADPNQMAAAAQTLLYDAWAQRTTRTTVLTRSYAWLDVADNVTVEYPRGTWTNKRITKITDTGQMLNVEMVDSDPSVYAIAYSGATPANPQTGVDYVAPTRMDLLDISILRDADNDCGLYGAFSGFSALWQGAIVRRSDAAGVFNDAGSVTSAATVGSTITALGTWTVNFIDETNTVDVQMTSGTPSSITRDQMLDTTANACLIGSEVLQFRTATSLGSGQYRLSGLHRGQRGTEWAMGSHVIGERFVLLETTGMLRFFMDVSEVGLARQYKALSIGGADETDATFTNTAVGRKPFSPVDLRRAISTTGASGYSWSRRTRLAENWLNGSVPLGEDTELYDVQLLDGSGNVLLSGQTTTNEWFPPASAVSLDQQYSGAEWAFQSYANSIYAINSAVNATVVKFAPSGDVAATSQVLGTQIFGTTTNGNSLYAATATFDAFGVVSGGYVQRVNLDDLSVPATYTAATAGDPRGVAFDGTSLWVAGGISGNLFKLDPVTLSAASSYSIAVGIEAISYASGSLWIARTSNDLATSEIIQVNASTGAITSRFNCVRWPVDVLVYGGNIFVVGISNVGVYNTSGVQLALISITGGAMGRQLVRYGAAQVAVLDDPSVNVSGQHIFVLNASDGSLADTIHSPYQNIRYLSGTTGGDLYVGGTASATSGNQSNKLKTGALSSAATLRVYQRSAQVGQGYPATLSLG